MLSTVPNLLAPGSTLSCESCHLLLVLGFFSFIFVSGATVLERFFEAGIDVHPLTCSINGRLHAAPGLVFKIRPSMCLVSVLFMRLLLCVSGSGWVVSWAFNFYRTLIELWSSFWICLMGGNGL